MNKSFARWLAIILLIPYSLFLFDFLAKDISFKNIIKVFTAVLGPIPLVIFIAYIFVANKDFIIKWMEEDSSFCVFGAFSHLLVTLLSTIFFMSFFDKFIYTDFSETTIPIFLNSLVLVMYIVNILFTDSIKMIAIFSGISMGISINVLFLT